MTEPGLRLPPIEDIDVEDLAALPRGYRYELHQGNLVVMTPSTFWHKRVARRLMFILYVAGLDVLQDCGVKGVRPRDLRLPDLGVLVQPPPDDPASYSNLPPSAYVLIIEIVSKNSPNGEFLEKRLWYAEHGIPEYWIVEETLEGSIDDGVITVMRLDESGDEPDYIEERSLLISQLEAEYRA
jgi:Uma2 family endonuclease